MTKPRLGRRYLNRRKVLALSEVYSVGIDNLEGDLDHMNPDDPDDAPRIERLEAVLADAREAMSIIRSRVKM